MRKNTRKHFAVDRLSEDGQAIVRKGVADRWTLERIQKALKAKTGDRISVASLQRYAKWLDLQMAIERQAQARELMLAALREDPEGEVAGYLGLLLEEALMERWKDEIGSVPPLELLDELNKQQRIRLEERSVAIAKQRADAEDRKAEAAVKRAEAAVLQAETTSKRVELLERQIKEAKEKLSGAEKKAANGKAVTPETLKSIREMFGIEESEESHA